MLDRPRSGENTLLLNIGLARSCDDDETQEFRALAESAGARIIEEVHARRERPDARYFIGRGKVEELAEKVRESNVELLLVNQPLTPSQERNLERALCARVLDRNGLILDIFAQRAATFEGKLQVELAQLKHLSTRLVRGWTHLERQKGGIGLRGPGETQLETDRRLLARRIRYLNERLERVDRRREVSRRERLRTAVPVVALVGYTNAGKTTLFNTLCGASLQARDQLFATLDPTIRRLPLGGGDEVLLVDTVGFVRDLPHELVAAFRSTLTETREAALLLHVIDASDPHHEDRCRQVENVIGEIGAADRPMLRVYNKCDRVAAASSVSPAWSGGDLSGDRLKGRRLEVSAITGQGIDELRDAIRRLAVGHLISGQIFLGPTKSRARARLFEWQAVRGEQADDTGGWTLDVQLTASRWDELRRSEGLAENDFRPLDQEASCSTIA